MWDVCPSIAADHRILNENITSLRSVDETAHLSIGRILSDRKVRQSGSFCKLSDFGGDAAFSPVVLLHSRGDLKDGWRGWHCRARAGVDAVAHDNTYDGRDHR